MFVCVCVCVYAKTEWKMKMAAMQGLTVSGILMARIQTLTQRHSTDPGQNFLGRSKRHKATHRLIINRTLMAPTDRQTQC